MSRVPSHFTFNVPSHPAAHQPESTTPQSDRGAAHAPATPHADHLDTAATPHSDTGPAPASPTLTPPASTQSARASFASPAGSRSGPASAPTTPVRAEVLEVFDDSLYSDRTREEWIYDGPGAYGDDTVKTPRFFRDSPEFAQRFPEKAAAFAARDAELDELARRNNAAHAAEVTRRQAAPLQSVLLGLSRLPAMYRTEGTANYASGADSPRPGAYMSGADAALYGSRLDSPHASFYNAGRESPRFASELSSFNSTTSSASPSSSPLTSPRSDDGGYDSDDLSRFNTEH